MKEIIYMIGGIIMLLGLGFLMLTFMNYYFNGYLSYFEDDNFCVDLFFEEYGELPLYHTQNAFGECIYKFSDLEQCYTPFSELTHKK